MQKKKKLHSIRLDETIKIQNYLASEGENSKILPTYVNFFFFLLSGEPAYSGMSCSSKTSLYMKEKRLENGSVRATSFLYKIKTL